MIWLVELSTADAQDPDLGSEHIVAWLSAPQGLRCLVEADDEGAARLRDRGQVTTIILAPDDLYVDAATRTVWEVFGGSSAVRLVGYVPP